MDRRKFRSFSPRFARFESFLVNFRKPSLRIVVNSPPPPPHPRRPEILILSNIRPPNVKVGRGCVCFSLHRPEPARSMLLLPQHTDQSSISEQHMQIWRCSSVHTVFRIGGSGWGNCWGAGSSAGICWRVCHAEWEKVSDSALLYLFCVGFVRLHACWNVLPGLSERPRWIKALKFFLVGLLS